MPRKKLPIRSVRIAVAVLDACREAGFADTDEQLHGAPLLWSQLGELGLWAPPPPPPLPERTLALLKPDSCVPAHVQTSRASSSSTTSTLCVGASGT